jgi:DNA-binding XRE family transcriptional regulator
MLRNVDWWLFTDVSGQTIGSIFKGQAVQEFLTCLQLIGCFETSVNDYQYTLCGIPEERRSQFYIAAEA